MGLLFSTVVSQAAHPTPAASNDVVISQVYGGGGNTGATYTHDFVELFNRGSMPIWRAAPARMWNSSRWKRLNPGARV